MLTNNDYNVSMDYNASMGYNVSMLSYVEACGSERRRD